MATLRVNLQSQGGNGILAQSTPILLAPPDDEDDVRVRAQPPPPLHRGALPLSRASGGLLPRFPHAPPPFSSATGGLQGLPHTPPPISSQTLPTAQPAHDTTYPEVRPGLEMGDGECPPPYSLHEGTNQRQGRILNLLENIGENIHYIPLYRLHFLRPIHNWHFPHIELSSYRSS